MAIRKEDIVKMVDSLSNEDKKAAYDFIQFLIERSKSNKPKFWEDVDKSKSVNEPLSDDELQQLESEEGYVSEEEAKREFNLQVDLP